jgi:glycerophosphoryl diester phosphodiesterase
MRLHLSARGHRRELEPMTIDPLAPRTILPAVLSIIRDTWRQLVFVDVLAKAIGLLAVTPAVTLLFRLAAARRGSAVLTDEEILWFVLSPFGLVVLLVVGAVVLWVLFAQHGAILAIAHATSAGSRMTALWAYGVVMRRGAAVLRLAAGLVLRLLLLSAPFVGAMAAVYLALLSGFDINYYLATRPPAFWIAGTLIALLALLLAVTLGIALVRWLCALPVLLFERVGVRTAFRRSVALTAGRRRAISGWLLTWAAASFAVASLLTGAVGAIGRLLVPQGSRSLAVVAVAVGVVFAVAVLLNLVISVVVASQLGVLAERLYVGCGGTGEPLLAFETPPRERAPASAGHVSRRALAAGLVAALVAVVAVVAWAASTVRVEDSTEITAHRGSSATAPENTLAAVEQAIADGADWVEIDVQELSDGTVVVLHDRDLKRLGGMPLTVAGSTYEELREVDVGSWFASEFADQRVPTLEQVLDLCRGHARVTIELKYYGALGTLAERVIRIVEEEEMASEVALMSLKHEAVRHMQTLRPGWTVGVLTAVALGNVARLDADFLAVNASLATRSFIRAAHRRGRAVHVWTVNDPLQMSVLMSRGVDNIITDVPAVARAVLMERAEMTAVERIMVEVGAWLGIVEVEDEGTEQ